MNTDPPDPPPNIEELEREQAELDFQHATDLTREMRTSEAEHWRDVRARLRAESFSESEAAMGSLAPEDTNLMLGTVFTRTGRLFTFELDSTEEKPAGVVVRWQEVDPSDWPVEVETASRVLGGDA